LYGQFFHGAIKFDPIHIVCMFLPLKGTMFINTYNYLKQCHSVLNTAGYKHVTPKVATQYLTCIIMCVLLNDVVIVIC